MAHVAGGAGAGAGQSEGGLRVGADALLPQQHPAPPPAHPAGGLVAPHQPAQPSRGTLSCCISLCIESKK